MSEPTITYLGPAIEADTGDRRMNSQWKLVPVEPTETMVINGFESVPNECFTDEEVWEQYQEMSGCQQAAFRAKLCWAAMLGSAPSAPTGGQPEVVAVIREEGEHFKETVVEHRPGIDRLLAGTELVDRAHVIRLQAECDALQLRMNKADQRIDELEQDKARLDALEANCWDVRYDSSPNGDAGDSSISIEIVGHWMDKPHERVIGEDYNENLRAAIDQAMTAPAYPPARPEYPDIDALLEAAVTP